MKRRSFLTVLMSVLLMMAVLPFCSPAYQVQAGSPDGPEVNGNGYLVWPFADLGGGFNVTAQDTKSGKIYVDEHAEGTTVGGSFDLLGALTKAEAPEGTYKVWITRCQDDWEGINPGGCIYDGTLGTVYYDYPPDFYVDAQGIARWNEDFGYSEKAISAHYNGKFYLDDDTGKLLDSYSYDLAGALAAKNAPTGTYDVWLMSGQETFDGQGIEYVQEATLRPKYQYTALTGISLSKTSLSLKAGNMATLTATIKPTNASARIVYWSSNNKNVATVDANGKITAKGPGTATITAAIGSKSAKCTVTVTLNKPKLINIYNSAKGADIRFQTVTGADSYLVMRKYKGVWAPVGNPVSVSSLQKEGGYYKIFDETIRDKYGEGYIYSVVACKGSHRSEFDTKGLPLYRLRAPTILSVTSTQSGKAVISWTQEACQGYEVQYSSDNGAHWTKATQVKDGSSTVQIISGLTSGKKYVFRIRCQKTNKDRGTTWSPYSPWKSVNVK